MALVDKRLVDVHLVDLILKMPFLLLTQQDMQFYIFFFRIVSQRSAMYIILFCGCGLGISGQPIPERLAFHYLTPDDGLSQVSINCLLKDRRGYIWVGTQDGLNRYNGDQFDVFKHNPLDSSSIEGNLINSLLEDEQGRIWVGTINHGINVFDPRTETFTHLRLPSAANPIVSAMVLSTNGSIYIATRNNGLFSIRHSEKQDFIIKKMVPTSEGLQSIHGLFLFNENTLLAGVEDGVYTIDVSSVEPKVSKLNVPGIIGQVKIFERKEDVLWIGSEGGLWSYHIKSKAIVSQDLLEPKSQQLSTLYEINDLQYIEHELWVAAGTGLFILSDWNPSAKRFNEVDAYHHQRFESMTLSHNSATSILWDSTCAYIGTSQFLNVSCNDKKFEVVRSSDIPGLSINNSIIFSLLKDESSNDLWIGTSGGGLNLKRGDRFYYFLKSSDPTSISDNIIRGIEKDAQNNLWLATTKGLSILPLDNFDPNNPEFISHISDLSEFDLKHNNLRDVLHIDGEYFIISYGGGLSRFTGDVDNKSFTFQTYRHEPTNHNSIPSDKIHCILAGASQHTFWLGTEDGLCHVSFPNGNYTKPKFKRFRHEKGNNKSISSNSVHDMALDEEGILWLGTRSGFSRFDPSTEQATSYSTTDGLIDPVIYIVQEDDFGYIWLATNNGLSRFHKISEKFTNFRVEEGLQNNEFDIKAKYKDEGGRIYLGGIDGFNIIDPADFTNQINPLPIYLESVVAHHPKKDKLIRIETNLEDYSSLGIDYNNFPVNIKFSSPDANPFRFIEYEYLLEPTSKNWNLIKNRGTLEFPELSPGEYTLQIRGKEGGVTWPESLLIPITVAPPWWKSTWACVLYFITLSGILYSIYRFQLTRKLAQQEAKRLKDLDALKTRLHTNITHEFRTPLTVILGMSDEIKNHLPNNQLEKVGRHLEMIERSGNNLLDLINQMLALDKIEAGEYALNVRCQNIVPYLHYLVQSFESIARHKELTITFYSEIEELSMDFDSDGLKKIIDNLISNAIKFTPAGGTIICHLTKKDDRCIIKIKDSGIGVGQADVKYIFDRFHQVNGHQDSNQSGSGIGLALVKELVSMMKGSISVQSKLNKGSEFSIEIPISTLAEPYSTDFQYQTISRNTETPLVVHQNTNESLPLVLVVEDNPDVAHYIISCINDQYRVMQAANGEEGADLAQKTLPDLIISDIMMPRKNGYEVCRELKALETTCHIPIILLTAKATIEEKISGLEYGADAYLTKPFFKKELLTRVQKLIEIRRTLWKKYGALNLDIRRKSSNDLNDQFIQKVVSIVHEHIDDPDFSSDFLAHKLTLSSSQVYRKLKALTGTSTAKFIRSIRLREARKLLVDSTMNVSEVAYATGFKDPAWFSRAFKEEYGNSPSMMQREH